MKSFFQFIVEADESALESANQKNTPFGEAYETATVIHLHNHTAAATNPNEKYQAKIEQVKQKHAVAMAKLPPNKQEQAVHLATRSSNAYMDSLKEHEGVEPKHIREVHHTSQGISQHLDKNVDRASNPHDVLIKGVKDRKSLKHGASLKAKPGTASNNSIASFDKISKSHGLEPNTTGH